MSNEKVVTLPACGGRAWLRTRLTDAQMGDYEDARTTRLPAPALAAMARAWRDGTLRRDGPARDDTDFLIAEGFTAPEIRQAAHAADRRVVEVICKRWADVRGPDSDALLEFPAGLPDLDPDDFTFLLAECYLAVGEGRADPNAGEPPTGDTSSTPADGPSPIYPETSETPTASTSPTLAMSA